MSPTEQRAAVHLQQLTRHVASVGRGEEEDGSGDVLGRAGPTQERTVDQTLMSLRGHAVAEELSAGDIPWYDRVDADAVAPLPSHLRRADRRSVTRWMAASRPDHLAVASC